MGSNYYKAVYLNKDSPKSLNFSCAIIPKYSMKAKKYLIEISRLFRMNCDAFIKPILYYFDKMFLYILYPSLERKILKIEKSNKGLYNNVKDLVILAKTMYDKSVAFRTFTTENLFIYDGKLKFLRTTNMVTFQELIAVSL